MLVSSVLIYITFANKCMGDINVSKIFPMKYVIDSLPFNLQGHENIPVTTYKPIATIRDKVCNYKQTLESIETDKGQSLYLYNCKNSEFCDPDHGYIITGNLCFIKTQKLRKLFTKGSNFREPQSLNYSRCKEEIDRAIEVFAGSLRLKHKLEDTVIDLWVNKAKQKVKNKITKNQNKLIILFLYCKMKNNVRHVSNIFKKNFVLFPLIKCQITFLLFVRSSMFLGC